MLIIFQTLFILFALFAIFNVIERKQEGLLGPKGMVFWILFWLVAGTSVLIPNSITTLANTFGIGRGADFVLYISIAVLFYIVFKLHIKLESIGRDITKVVRKDTIEEGIRDKE